MKTGIDQIRQEREIQKNYGLNQEHQNTGRELLKAAVCILLFHLPGEHPMTTNHSWFRALPEWIQDLGEDLSSSYEEALRTAGAFCAAELDRLRKQGIWDTMGDPDVDTFDLLVEIRNLVDASCMVQFDTTGEVFEEDNQPKGGWIEIKAEVGQKTVRTGHQVTGKNLGKGLNEEKKQRLAELAVGRLNQRINVYRGKEYGDD